MNCQTHELIKINDQNIIIRSLSLIGNGAHIIAEISVSSTNNICTYKCLLAHNDIIKIILEEVTPDIASDIDTGSL